MCENVLLGRLKPKIYHHPDDDQRNLGWEYSGYFKFLTVHGHPGDSQVCADHQGENGTRQQKIRVKTLAGFLLEES